MGNLYCSIQRFRLKTTRAMTQTYVKSPRFLGDPLRDAGIQKAGSCREQRIEHTSPLPMGRPMPPLKRSCISSIGAAKENRNPVAGDAGSARFFSPSATRYLSPFSPFILFQFLIRPRFWPAHHSIQTGLVRRGQPMFLKENGWVGLSFMKHPSLNKEDQESIR